jgi:hypothetical protein
MPRPPSGPVAFLPLAATLAISPETGLALVGRESRHRERRRRGRESVPLANLATEYAELCSNARGGYYQRTARSGMFA